MRQSALNLDWKKNSQGLWTPLQGTHFRRDVLHGNYIIWYAGNPGRVVYVGQGDVGDRLSSHQSDVRITYYALLGKLYVTWASVPAQYRDGVDRYLAETWNPLVGERHPIARPIAVNSPW